MYGLHDYTWMITDEERMGAYVRALEAVVRPGSVVADLGTGTGILALVACRLGARRVFAIDTNDAIEVGRELARENGVADRIVFFQKDSREVELPEPADVVVSDLRGTLPLNRHNVSVIVDARARFLKPQGVLIPARDRLMVGVVEKPQLHEWALGPARGPLGVTLEAMRARLAQAAVVESPVLGLQPADLLCHPEAWAVLDYSELEPGSVSGQVQMRVERAGVGHGLTLWFEAELAGGEGFTTGPGHALCYGRLFLPWPCPVAVEKDDVVAVELWAQSTGDPWGWNSSIQTRTGSLRESFKQSTFIGFPGKPRARPALARASAISQTPRD
jgi:protein arginine N-methyltransferase 1